MGKKRRRSMDLSNSVPPEKKRLKTVIAEEKRETELKMREGKTCVVFDDYNPGPGINFDSEKDMKELLEFIEEMEAEGTDTCEGIVIWEFDNCDPDWDEPLKEYTLQSFKAEVRRKGLSDIP